jgi:ABC-type uncharacterized transport system auxiliary subunit
MTNSRKHAVRAAFALICAVAISGCGSTRYPAHYILNFEPSAHSSASGPGTGTLAISELQCPDYLCEGRIVYRATPAEIGFYQYHRWAVSPGAMIAQYLTERVRARSLFASVSGDQSQIATDFVLGGTIERLEEVDEDRRVAALCTLSVQLMDIRTKSVVWSGTTTERVAVTQHDVQGVVDGLTAAVRTSVERLVTDMERELARSTALPCADPYMPCAGRHQR